MSGDTKEGSNYVFEDGNFIGDFDQMYANLDDPWMQTEEIFASEKAVCLNLIGKFRRTKVVEFGSGLGYFTKQLAQVAENVIGVEISPNAVNRARALHPQLDFRCAPFPDLEFLRNLKPDCIVMAEITWYVLDELDHFINFLKTEMPHLLLIHLLTTYEKGEQKYGAEKFTNLEEILNYFDINVVEYGEVYRPCAGGGGSRTFFAGTYSRFSP